MSARAMAWRKPRGQQLGAADDAVLPVGKVPPRRSADAKLCGHPQVMPTSPLSNDGLSTNAVRRTAWISTIAVLLHNVKDPSVQSR